MIEEFGPHAEERFERRFHEIVRRAVNSSIPTNGTTQSSKPTSSAKSNSSTTQSPTPSTGRLNTTSTWNSSGTPTDSPKVMSTTPGTNITNNISNTEVIYNYYFLFLS